MPLQYHNFEAQNEKKIVAQKKIYSSSARSVQVLPKNKTISEYIERKLTQLSIDLYCLLLLSY